VDDSVVVAVFRAVKQLSEEVSGQLLVEPSIVNNVLDQVSSVGAFKDNDSLELLHKLGVLGSVGGGLASVEVGDFHVVDQFDDVVVGDRLQNSHFSSQVSDILVHQVLVDFDGAVLSVLQVLGQVDSRLDSVSELLDEHVLAVDDLANILVFSAFHGTVRVINNRY
jgi:hypothetical protein